MGSSLRSYTTSLAVFVCLSLLHSAFLEAAAGATKPTPTSSTSPLQANPAQAVARRSANEALLNVNELAQKQMLGKGYGGPKNYREQPKEGYGNGPSNYGAPEQSYGPLNQEYGPPQIAYGIHQQGYGPRKQSYGPPHQGYGPPQQSYGPPLADYGPPLLNYGPPQQGYGTPEQGYGGLQQGYALPPQNYEPPQQGYGQQEGGYGPQNYEQEGYRDSQSYSFHGHGPFHYENVYGYSYDTHYCSVHGSFSLALSHHDQDYGKKNEGYSSDNKDGYGDSKKEGYGSDKPGYGGQPDSGYGVDSYAKKPNYKPRFHTRQYCRYAAAASERSCKFCCRVVARSSNTSPDEIVSAIFNFDPAEPTANGAGFDHYDRKQGGYVDKQNKDYSKDSGYGKSSYEEKSYGRSAFQCVCCAPKTEHHYSKK